jgi:hypothetical protein
VQAFEERPTLRSVNLTVLLPSWITGPLLNPCGPPPTSLELLIALSSGEYPFAPNLYVQVVDVRDTGTHLSCLRGQSTAHRILL